MSSKRTRLEIFDSRLLLTISISAGVGAVFLFIYCGLLVAVQTLHWLRTAEWFSVPAVVALLPHESKHSVLEWVPSFVQLGREIERLANTEWKGVHKIISSLLLQPFGIYVFLVAVALTWVSIKTAKENR